MAEKRKPREWWLVTSQSMRDGVPETPEAVVFTDEGEARDFAQPMGWEVVPVREVMPEEDDDGDDEGMSDGVLDYRT